MINAFNDHFAKLILIPFGIALVASGQGFRGIEHVFGVLLVLPLILLAPTAVWLEDRFEKSRTIRWAAWFQLVAIICMAGGLWLGARFGEKWGGLALGWVILAFLLLATQSALFGPAQKGIVKELPGSGKLVFRNGILEGNLIFAIVAGQMMGGLWFDVGGLQRGLDPWTAALVPVACLIGAAFFAIWLSSRIQETKAMGNEPYSGALAFRHFRDLGMLWKLMPLRRCALGVAFFWGFGGFLQFVLVQQARETVGGLGGFGLEMVLLWIPVVAGVVFGSLTASWICRRANQMGLIAFGGLLMTFSMLLLGIVSWGEMGLRLLLAMSGAGAAMLLVPLKTYFQGQLAESETWLVISGANLLIHLAGLAAVALQYVLKEAGVPIRGQFLLASVVCAWVTYSSIRLLPKDFILLLILGLFRSVYRIRALGVEKVPKTGGVLMVPNHLTYIDIFVLSAASPRPIRFVMFADCFEKKWLGGVARFFDAVSISPTTAREGIRVVAEALRGGSLVCVFAEGQLSRTGGLCEIKRGYQMMAKRGGVSVLPTYMDGLWGSMWSFAEGNFLRKAPRKLRYGVTVAFGELLSAEGDLPSALRELSVQTMADREKEFRKKRNREPQVAGVLPRGWIDLMERCWAEDEGGRAMRFNALQLSQVNLASRKTRLLVEWRADDELSGILGILWPLAVGARVSLADGLSDRALLAKVAREGIDAVALRGVKGREPLVSQLQSRGILIWNFDKTGLSDGRVFGCLVQGNRVISFARPHPDHQTTTGLPQRGWREGRRGKLLPGWSAERFGPLDEEGFLFE